MALCHCILVVALYAAGVRALLTPPPAKAADDSPLPSIGQVLHRPRHLLKSMTSHVEELATHLVALQGRSTKDVSKQKAQYEESLRRQRVESASIEKKNAMIRSHIEDMRKDSATIRTKTNKLITGSRRFVDMLKGIRENFTETDEVLTNVLQEAHERTRSPKLQVLQDLLDKDASQQQDLEHQRRLSEIGKPSDLALLQFKSEPVNSQKEARELVESLMASLGSLTEEQNASSVTLTEHFEKQWEEGVKRQSSLLEEQVKLNATEVQEHERNDKVHVAFDYALEVNTHLKKRLAVLRRFAHKVSDRAIPGVQEKRARKLAAKHRKMTSHRK